MRPPSGEERPRPRSGGGFFPRRGRIVVAASGGALHNEVTAYPRNALFRRSWDMKRWLLAVAALFCGAVSVSYADYVIIKYNLSAERENTEQPGQPGLAGPMAGGSGGAGQAGPMAGGGGGAGQAGPMAGGSGGFPGGPMGMGPGMMQPAAQGGEPGELPEDIEISPLWVVAVVELKVPPDYKYMTPQAKKLGYPCKIAHKW